MQDYCRVGSLEIAHLLVPHTLHDYCRVGSLESLM